MVSQSWSLLEETRQSSKASALSDVSERKACLGITAEGELSFGATCVARGAECVLRHG